LQHALLSRQVLKALFTDLCTRARVLSACLGLRLTRGLCSWQVQIWFGMKGQGGRLERLGGLRTRKGLQLLQERLRWGLHTYLWLLMGCLDGLCIGERLQLLQGRLLRGWRNSMELWGGDLNGLRVGKGPQLWSLSLPMLHAG